MLALRRGAMVKAAGETGRGPNAKEHAPMKRHLIAAAAAVAMLAGAAGGAAAVADGNNAPYEKSCVGIISSFQAAGLGITPAEGAAAQGKSVREYQELQRNCKIFNG